MGIWEWLLLLLLLFGGIRQEVSEPVAIGDEGESSLEIITDYGSEIFTEDEGWEVFQSYEGNLGSFSVAWTDSEGLVVIHIVDYPTISYNENRMFSVEWMESSLEPGYDDLDFDEQCEEDEVYLFEFEVEHHGVPYRTRTWIFYVNDSYIRNVVFIFPADREDEMDEYSEQMFPDLSTCED